MRDFLPAVIICCLATGCAATEPPLDESVAAATTRMIQLNLLYLHGVENSASGRTGAHNTLNDLKAAVAADLPSLIASYQASHPGVTINVASASANLYTATPSGIHPSDSTDPTLMDDWRSAIRAARRPARAIRAPPHTSGGSGWSRRSGGCSRRPPRTSS
jgi:hypothetical protein